MTISPRAGSISLLWADIAARTLMALGDLPIRIVSGLIGGVFCLASRKGESLIFRILDVVE